MSDSLVPIPQEAHVWDEAKLKVADLLMVAAPDDIHGPSLEVSGKNDNVHVYVFIEVLS